ncbi:MAG: O-antigen ligase family protein [Dysgonamonadaceae bacterium]|jgi:O-antigen ligase|nr:O-antigen ligase family protein [Dysgonamonadaceae bacterium]
MKKYIDEILVLGFAVSVYFSALVANDTWQNTGKLCGFGLLIALYFVLRLLFSTGKSWGGNVVGLLLVAAGVFEASLGLLQIYGFKPSNHGLFRLTGTFFNPGPFAGFLAVVAPVAVWFLLEKDSIKGLKTPKILKRLKTILALLTVFAILLVLPAAMSRAAWLAVIAGCGLVVLNQSQIKSKITALSRVHRKKIIVAGCSLAVASVIALSGIYFLKKDSADGRLLTWKIALKTSVKYPAGVGLGNFSGAYGDEQAAYFASGKASETEEYVAGNAEYAFNEYLQILVESGIISLLLFCAILVLALKRLLKLNIGLAGALVSLLVFAAFSYPLSLCEFCVTLVVLMSVSVNQKETGIKRLRVIICGLIIVAAAPLLVYRLYPAYQAKQQWERSQYFYHSGLHKEVVKTYRPLYNDLQDRVEFLFQYGRSLSMTEQYEESNTVLRRATNISCDPMFYNIMGNNYKALKKNEKAEESYLKASQIVPNRLYPYYLLMKLYDETGEREKALRVAETVLKKEPKVQSKAIEEMREDARKVINNK